jgi:cellulose synthase/poly-beta-1,6-N-acetylglucosamine synthase-like glycosyltransferase
VLVIASFFTVLAVLSLLYWCFMLCDTLRTRPLILRLPGSDGAQGRTTPLVSVIIAAKEEEVSIAETVKHLLGQTYQRLEIIAVNDRSQDTTGTKLDELRRWSEGKRELGIPLRVIHITKLPEGWLGKNHALYQGYLESRGSILLFTDADVLFQPTAVEDAVRFMQQEQADHLALLPRIEAKGFWLRAFVQYFFFAFTMGIRPWQANKDFSERGGMGIGAFNMITRDAYEKLGTHQAIALRPDDDLQLGRRVKRFRLRQRLASAIDHLEVEWYHSLDEAVRGLEKNIFSGFGYRTWLAVLAVLGQLAFFSWPWYAAVILLVMGKGLSILYLISAGMMSACQIMLMRFTSDFRLRDLATLPATSLLFCWVLIRSVYLTLRQGGIYWRGTFYSLKELRRMKDSSS